MTGHFSTHGVGVERSTYDIDIIISDGNSWEDDSSSSSSFEEEAVVEYSPELIFDLYKLYLKDAVTLVEVCNRSMDFMAKIFPQEILATNKDDLQSNYSTVHMFLTDITQVITDHIYENDQDQQITHTLLLEFRAAVMTWNTSLLLNVPVNHPAIFQTYVAMPSIAT